ncbi:MAG: hypothetical protein ACE1Y9_01580, partial [Acidimicrobiia bacterium]
NNLIEGLIEGTKETLNNVSQSISNEMKKTFATSAAVMTRQEKMIVKFYGINSQLLSEAQENFKKFILNYSEMVEKESQRLEWLSTKQLRPEEFMLNMNKTNAGRCHLLRRASSSAILGTPPYDPGHGRQRFRLPLGDRGTSLLKAHAGSE